MPENVLLFHNKIAQSLYPVTQKPKTTLKELQVMLLHVILMELRMGDEGF